MEQSTDIKQVPEPVKVVKTLYCNQGGQHLLRVSSANDPGLVFNITEHCLRFDMIAVDVIRCAVCVYQRYLGASEEERQAMLRSMISLVTSTLKEIGPTQLSQQEFVPNPDRFKLLNPFVSEHKMNRYFTVIAASQDARIRVEMKVPDVSYDEACANVDALVYSPQHVASMLVYMDALEMRDGACACSSTEPQHQYPFKFDINQFEKAVPNISDRDLALFVNYIYRNHWVKVDSLLEKPLSIRRRLALAEWNESRFYDPNFVHNILAKLTIENNAKFYECHCCVLGAQRRLAQMPDCLSSREPERKDTQEFSKLCVENLSTQMEQTL